MVETFLDLAFYGTSKPTARHPIIDWGKWFLPAAIAFDLWTLYYFTQR